MAKIENYLGFAVKSGKIIYGLDNIERSRKCKYVLVLCPTASKNLSEYAEKYAEKFDIPIIKTDKPLEEIIFKRNCKLVALLDPNMAKAVTDNGR